jgi:hypothetical protein
LLHDPTSSMGPPLLDGGTLSLRDC